MMTREQVYHLSKDYTMFTWAAQEGYDPICVEKAEGVYFWDMNGTRYMDLSSQLVCTNIGFGNEAIVKAIQEQAAVFPYVAPRHTFSKRAELGRLLLEEVAPKNMGKVLFSLGGADANEYAIRLVKSYTGRQKIFAKYASYHGSSYGAGSLTGEAFRSIPAPQMPGVVHFEAPHTYTYDIRFETEEAASAHFLARLESQMLYEGPDQIAALFIEPVPGSNGIHIYPKGYLKGLRDLCTKYGIIMVCDEVMTGFGRCGEWFASQHFGIEPDVITFAKGVNSGYAPLGGVLLSKTISDYYEKNSLPAGMTYNSHALGVAAAIANINEFKRLDLLNHVKKMGKQLGEGLEKIKAKHACVGDVRYVGLFSAIELVKNKETREPITQDSAGKPLLASITANLKARGFTTVGFKNFFTFAPALIVNEAELQAMLDGVDAMLGDYDSLAK